MLLTVHNLPLNVTYAELKSLIYNQCGLSDIILDHLVKEGSSKKVTVGLADEGDAAIFVRKINGLYMNGQHLYVEDVRKRRDVDQPYHITARDDNESSLHENIPTTNTIMNNQNMVLGSEPQYHGNANDNQLPYYQTMTANNSSIDNHNMQTQLQPAMQDYSRIPEDKIYYKMPSNQNFTPTGYGNQNQSYVPYDNQNQYRYSKFRTSEKGYPYENQMVEENFQNVPQDRNFRRDNQHRSPQRSQGRDQNLPKTQNTVWVVGHNPVPERERRNKTPPRVSWDAREHNERNTFRNSNDDFYARDSSKDLTQNIGQRQGYGTGYEPYIPSNQYVNKIHNNRGQQSRPLNAVEESLFETQMFGSHVMESNIPGSSSNQWMQEKGQQSTIERNVRNPVSGERFQPGNSADNFISNDTGYDSNYEQSNVLQRPSANSYRSAEPPFIRSRFQNDSNFGSSQRDTKTFAKSVPKLHSKKPYDERGNNWAEKKYFKQPEVGTNTRKRSFQVGNRSTEPSPKKSYPHSTYDYYAQGKRNPNRIPPKKELPKKDQKHTEMMKMIHKDQTWRGQAASVLAKEMVKSFGEIPPKLFTQLKASIRSRIDILLRDEFSMQYDKIIELYRKKFHRNTDKTFFKSVKEIVDNGASEKFYEDTPIINFTDKNEKDQDSKKDLLKPMPDLEMDAKISGKELVKQQKKIAKLEYQADFSYELPQHFQEALDAEIEAIITSFKDTVSNPDDVSEKIIRQKIFIDAVSNFKEVVGLHVTKRILDVRTGLVVKVLCIGKLPSKPVLIDFLTRHGCIALRRTARKKSYVATLDNYENYDKLCAMKQAVIDGISVKFAPLHIIGPPKSRSNVKDQNAKRNKSENNESTSNAVMAPDKSNNEVCFKESSDKSIIILDDEEGIDQIKIEIKDDDTDNELKPKEMEKNNEMGVLKLEENINNIMDIGLNEEDLDDY